MLVIRRHPGEAIQIGGDVEVVVIECGQGRVKLGIRAPKEIPVMRSEVRLTREQNLAASLWKAASDFVLPPELRQVSAIQVQEVRTDKHL